MGLVDVIRLAARKTVAQVMAREDFAKRYADGVDIRLHEILYPLLQGWDSVVIDADVEMGGSDQLFNNLVGREFQEAMGKPAQVVIVTPLLVGTDGVKKMSKSLGNYIGVTDPPNDMFGKAMSISDHLMPDYYSLVLDRPMPDAVPVEQKRELARSLVRTFHDEGAEAEAEKTFDALVRRQVPDDVPEVQVPADGEIWIVDLITRAGFATTNGEARRFIRGGAVRLDGEVVTDEKLSLAVEKVRGKVLQVGKRRYARLV
jgi:tyrosyl-tRNA synthetase